MIGFTSTGFLVYLYVYVYVFILLLSIFTCHPLDELDKIFDSMSLLTLNPDDYHTNYSGLFAALTTNKHLRQAITEIHNMTDITGATEPILLNTDAVLTPASESLTTQFLDTITPNTLLTDTLSDPNHPSRVIWKEKLKRAANISTLPKEAKDLIEKATNPNHDLDETDDNFILAATPLNNLARQCGFSTFSQMTTIFRLNLDNEGERRGRQKQVFSCLMSPSDLGELSVWQPQILVDDKSSPFKRLLFNFLKSASTSTTTTPTTSTSTSASSRSLTIVKNCMSIVAALLQNQPPTLSLNRLASISQHQVRFPPRRTVEKALRVKDLSHLEPPQTYTCFWCPPLAPKDDTLPIHESLLPFQPELSDVNTFRLHCYYSEKA